MNVISLPSLRAQVSAATTVRGQVQVVPFLDTGAPTNLSARSLTFDSSARTHWHSHPLGRLLVVIHGRGVVQQRGQSVQALTNGDVVWAPPDVEHWHGGGSEGGATHIAVQQQLPDAAAGQGNERVDDDSLSTQPQPQPQQASVASTDQPTVQVFHTASLPTSSEHNAHCSPAQCT